MSQQQQQEEHKTEKKGGEAAGPKRVTQFDLRVFAADVATGAVVAGTASIPISIIDFSIMAKVAGVVPTMGHQLKAGIKTLLFKPKNFFIVDTPNTYYALVYRVCFTVYFLTYAVANGTRSYCEAKGDSPEAVAWKCGISSSVINTGLTVWKDSLILRALPGKFVGGAASNHVPMLSRLGFAFRDTLTCIAAFTLVPLLRDYFLRTQPDWSLQQSKTTASLLTPVSMQLITTLVHIPSIKYQRMYGPGVQWNGKEGYIAGMMSQLKIDYIGALRLRMLRIFCAFGVGTLINSDLRMSLITKFSPEALSSS